MNRIICERRAGHLEQLELRNLLAADFHLQLLHASDLEGGVEAIRDAPNFAAIVEGLEVDAAAQGVSSILLSAGDNFIPGPFFSVLSSCAEADRGSYLFKLVTGVENDVGTKTSTEKTGDGRPAIGIATESSIRRI